MERIAKLIATDLLNAVEALYGEEGLRRVVDHAKAENRSRQSNEDMDALEKAFADLEG